MEQRPLRLGDIVDDYCPRERRLTNHAIVALVGDAIRQTRCTTCDTEHVYKEGRVPRRKKKDETAALYDQVLADAGATPPAPPRPARRPQAGVDAGAEPAPVGPAPMLADDGPSGPPPAAEAPQADVQAEEPSDNDNGHHDLWPAHRQLIRATLPRTENDPPAARPIPEFTMHQRPQHRGGFRHGQGHWHGNGQPRHGANNGRPGRSGGEPNGNVPPGQGQGSGRRRRRGGRHRRSR